jgi:hypothetical protein
MGEAMRTPRVLFAALLLLNATIASGQSVRTKPASGSESEDDGARTAAALVGTWRSAQERVPLNSPFDISVWGKGANSVRAVDMTIKGSGEGTVTVTRKVTDARNRTVPGSTAIERAEVVVGESREGLAGQREYELKVVKAERRYPDFAGSVWALDGLKVKLSVAGGASPQSLEIRFDTPEGDGSFWDTLRRAAAAAPKRAAP